MAYSVPPLVITGDIIPASYGNTYVRDNWAASAVAQIAAGGDLVYGTGATALTRLAIGPANYALVSTGSAPGWNRLTPAGAAQTLLTGFLQAGTWTYAYNGDGTIDTMTMSAAGPLNGYQLKFTYSGALVAAMQLKSSAGGSVVATVTYSYSGNQIATEAHS